MSDPAPADAIPWLLLEAKSWQGKGIFGQVKWIQRLNTVGGRAPTEDCSRTSQTQECKVSYTADYYFYKPSNAEKSHY